METMPSTSGALESDHLSSHNAASFLDSGVRVLSPEALALRQTQLRVAFGISGTTLVGSLGLATAFVIKLARKHLRDEETDDEEEAEVDEEAQKHEADIGAGQRAAALAPDRPRISIHNNKPVPSKAEPLLVAM